MALTTKPSFNRYVVDKTSPSARSIEITPHDTNFLADASDNPIFTRGIIVAVAGDVVVEFANDAEDDTRTITVLAGVVYPFAICRVMSTGTTATGIIGLL